MLFIFGIRMARIGRYFDRDHICYHCNASDREVLVYRSYFHFCLIPVFPAGSKRWEMRCRNCGDETVLESVVETYQGKVRTPVYLYSAIILFAGLAISWFFWNQNTQRQKMEWVTHPASGDVYTMTREENHQAIFSFLKIIAVNGDSLTVLHNHWDYGEFVSRLTADDYFVKEDTVWMKQKDLRRMLDKDEIYSIDRNYGEGSGFNRIK
jgi:hypothetical protein